MTDDRERSIGVEPCRRWRELLGVDALGQLDGDEAASLRAHLDGCEACRTEATALRATAARLALASPEHLDAPLTPPPALDDRIVQRVATAQRTRRRHDARRAGALVGALVATVAAAAAATALLVGGSNDQGTPARDAPVGQRIPFEDLPPNVAMVAHVAPRPWGTRIELAVKGARDGVLCRVFVRRAGGGPAEPVGAFRYTDRAEASNHVVLASSVPRSQATAIVVRAAPWTYVAPIPRSRSTP